MASKLQKALFSAIEHQYLAQVKKIVQAREKASLITDWQKLLEPKSLDTVLHAAVRVKHESILKYLLENCSSCLEQSNSSSMRPLHVATVQCHMYAVNLLLAAGAEVDAPSENHMTPLMLASGQQERDALHIVRMLLNSGANGAACNTVS
ncbi:ankyrin repeat domain-containing protein 16-like [Hyalella azteca]|uniref:Ankyrin repeat domain-containing protein 16-like n=1 Tax=Hyalella azteca TaxID=294128 RepID=A0A8B7NMR6_HYAAZ|nr:ankyrin repeat domain-containing protein 16-like [Hyalella azteca]